ncbi:MAG: S41 family peptidase [Clostridiales bacterium]|jgi:carboxyl-terminal processing protease|nr:S41 family peptidase [Clostridiales bacterium]
MRDKKAFFIGLSAGLLAMAVFFFCFGLVSRRVTWSDEKAPDDKVREVLTLLDKYSINEYEREELMDSMYRGLLDGVGDPYTHYFDEEAFVAFTEQTEGVYAGLGMVVTGDAADGIVTIVSVYPSAPAGRAGLQPGDKIMAVDGTDVTSYKLEEVTSKTKGRPGTKVTLTIYRPADDYPFDVPVMREMISIPTVSHKMFDGNIGYIRIEQFERVTLNQFTEAYQDLTAREMKALIIDVRNNPGGLLDTVTQIADVLLPNGVVTYTEDKNGAKKYYRSEESHAEVPIAVLTNGGSASASEVLCGAVRDMGMGVLVGTKTFGKGIVQNLYMLSDGSAIKVTVAKYYTPNGVCIQGEGLIPDYVVEVDKETALRSGALSPDEDMQLQKAMEVLRQKL